MKKKLIAITLALTLTLLAACGTGEPASVSVPEEPESFGAAVSSAIQEESVIPAPEASEATVESPEASVSDTQEVESAPEPRDLSERALFTVAYCYGVDQLRYDPEDPQYFWRAVGYLAGLSGEDMGLPVEEGFVTLTQEDVRLFSLALFAGYSGELPAVTEEDPLVSRGENDTWRIHMLDTSDFTADYTYAEDGSSCTVSMALRGEPLEETLTITTVSHVGTEAGAAWFPRAISDVSSDR